MIDLSRTRVGLLAEIEAPHPAGVPLDDITDPSVATTDSHVRVHGHARRDLFPLLKLAFSERFAAVTRLELIGDLLIPLRNALGNACRHGNASDPAKAVCVEIVLTGKGALIAVTDEGAGFDVALTFRRFQEQQDYFVNRGSGFRNLHGARSTVSYENGGRTVLLCFRPAIWGSDPLGNSFPKALDSEWIKTSLTAELPEFANGRTRLESCRVYETRGPAGDNCGNRYVLRVAGLDGRTAETRILTGRLHAAETAAAADFEAASRLHEAKLSKGVLIPRPVARPAGEPRLVLYDFDPWMNLWEYMRFRRSLKSLRRCAERFGRALAHLHRSQVALSDVETDSIGAGLQAMVALAEKNLQTLPSRSNLVNRFQACVQRIEERAAFGRRRTLTPMHGAFGWDCIHYGVDGRFYFYRFETCRRSDPGLDLGGYAADLLCFTLSGLDDGVYRICSDDFLSHYNSEAEHPMGGEDLRLYTVLALAERLQRAETRAKTKSAQLLTALDAALSDSARVAASEVGS